MRYTGPVGFSFSGDKFKASGLTRLARTLMGKQDEYMSFHNLPSNRKRKTLPDGSKIELIQLPGGIRRIQIYSPIILDESVVIQGGIICRPRSDEYNGWGFPYVDGGGLPINGILGTEDGTYPRVIYRNGKCIRSDAWEPLFSLDDRWDKAGDYGFSDNLAVGKIDWRDITEKIILSWTGRSRYFQRLNGDTSLYIYKDGFYFAKSPPTTDATDPSNSTYRVVGVALNSTTEKLIMCGVSWDDTTKKTIEYKWFQRNWKTSGYSNDNLYHVTTEPDGWELLGGYSYTSTEFEHAYSLEFSNVLFNSSGTECVFITDNGKKYLRYSVSDTSVSLVESETSTLGESETYSRDNIDIGTSIVDTTVYEDVTYLGCDDAPDLEWTYSTQTRTTGESSDLIVIENKLAVDYDRDDFIYLAMKTRRQYNNQRVNEMVKRSHNEYHWSCEGNTISINANTIYINNVDSYDYNINDKKLSLISESNGDIFDIYLYNNNISWDESYYYKDATAQTFTGSRTGVYSSVTSGKYISSDLRKQFLHYYTAQNTGYDYSRSYYYSGSPKYTLTYDEYTIEDTEKVMLNGSDRHLNIGSTTEYPSGTSTGGIGITVGHPNVSYVGDNSTTDSGLSLSSDHTLSNLILKDGNGWYRNEYAWKGEEWIYCVELLYKDPDVVGFIDEYSEGDIDVLSPIYTTELRNEIRGVI